MFGIFSRYWSRRTGMNSHVRLELAVVVLAMAAIFSLDLPLTNPLSAPAPQQRRTLGQATQETPPRDDGRTAELMSPLVHELYEFMCEEMVSKLIGYDIRKTTLRERFLSVLDAAEEAQ